MGKVINCTFSPGELLTEYPEFYRLETTLGLVETYGAYPSIDLYELHGDKFAEVRLFEPGEHVMNTALTIITVDGDRFNITCQTPDVNWFNTLARKVKEEFDNKGRNDFIYYRNTDGKVMCNRRVVCAAMRIDGIVVLGARHGSPLMNQAINHAFDHDESRVIAASNKELVEGFTDQYDLFWDREQALTIAICSDQIRKRTRDRSLLWSEDVW